MMRRTEQQVTDDNKTLDEVTAQTPEHMVTWFRSLYHTHQEQTMWWQNHAKELRDTVLSLSDGRLLTVKEAQLCNVCRICRGPNVPNGKGAFLLNFGEEHAHESCIKEAT